MGEQMQYYSSSLWEQDYYQQNAVWELVTGFPDANENIYSQSHSVIPDDHKSGLTNVDVARNMQTVSSPETGKPKRRRSKSSSPSQSTTFLNASIKDFRALVQQHTGCHSTATITASSPKGPITLCFASPPSTHHHYYS